MDHSFTTWLAHHRGVAHSSIARLAGFSGRTMADAVESGQVLRIRRSWLALPGSDRRLIAAANAGARVSCVSAAAMQELWTPPDDGRLHVAVKPTASRVAGPDLVVHWGTGPMPVPPGSLIDPLVDVLFHVARCLPRRDAFAVWESATRQGLVHPDELRRILWHSSAASELAVAASVLSDSGTESIFVRGTRSLGLPVRQQVWIDGHPLDAVIGDMLLVQLDGFAHHSEARARRRDLRADARLALRGYTVLRFDWYQVLFEWPEVERAVLTAVAQGLHLASGARRA